MHYDVEKARVLGGEQPTLFPLGEYSSAPKSPQAVCEAIGLSWYAAEKLFSDGLLSFDPNDADSLSLAELAELRFLGSLAAAGCSSALLDRLLSELQKPYCYRLDRMYYDWESGAWQILRGDEDVQLDFERWLERLIEAEELEKLERIRDSVEGAIFKLRQYYARFSPW
jgi:hypothetical protein